MSDVSIIGLGKMGSALATGLLRGHQRVTVWNRTADKATPLVSEGATRADTAEMAVTSSPIVIVCVDGYEVTRQIMDSATPALAGRTIVQLSTGTPREAQVGEARIQSAGAAYLDGAILAFPDDIATPDCTILVAGTASGFTACEAPLRILAPKLKYVGELVGSASALDCAILSVATGMMLGTAHGLRLAEAEGSLEQFCELLSDVAPLFADDIGYMTSVVREGNYTDPPASVATWSAVMRRLQHQAFDAKIDLTFPAFAVELFDRAVAAGLGDEEPGALVKVLRDHAVSTSSSDQRANPSVS